MPFSMKVSKDQSELDEILSHQNKKFTQLEREALVLCDATEDYPLRTVRSKINGARVYIEKDGVWTFPVRGYWEEFQATHPELNEEELEEAEDKYLPF